MIGKLDKQPHLNWCASKSLTPKILQDSLKKECLSSIANMAFFEFISSNLQVDPSAINKILIGIIDEYFAINPPHPRTSSSGCAEIISNLDESFIKGFCSLKEFIL